MFVSYKHYFVFNACSLILPSHSMPASTSSSSAQAHLLPSPSAIIPTIQKSVPTLSNSENSNAPEIPQGVKRNSRNKRKSPKVQNPGIEIKMAPHRPRKSAATEYATDEEDMIPYDVEEEELGPNPTVKFALKESPTSYPKGYLRALTPTRFRKRKNQDMLQLAEELGINAPLNMTVPNIKIAITNSEGYEEEFVKNLYETIIPNGKRLEELERAEKIRLEELVKEQVH
ncbi:hypothetical protein TNCV_83751 [Trichonephila clavipes]|nr:hypothetical protein TNCV_83751 [Trichonephila clavipes]